MACLVSRSTTSTIERMEVPIRSEPEELNLTIFQDWKVRWNDYAAATRVKEETPNLGARHAIIRSALAKEWSLLWQAGCLEINYCIQTRVICQKEAKPGPRSKTVSF